MIRKLLALLIITACFSHLTASAQMIDSMMKVYSDKFPQEKLYLQFDKKAYNPGDRIWYKAYLFTGFDPSPYSKNLYTEIYDAGGNLILRNTSPIHESTASGSFDIPTSFANTRIHIKAYTTWMLNFDTSFVFTRDLRVIGSASDSVHHTDASATELHFFPEGGDMIAGIDNNIAFKAEDEFGRPKKVTGVLYDQTGKMLLNFNSVHDGMGKFLLVPDKDVTLYAIWKDEKGIEQRTDLPPIKSSGITLRVLNSGQKLLFSIARQAESLTFKKVIIIAHMNQQLVYKAFVNLTDLAIGGGNIPIDQLPTGVLTVTIFDMNQVPLAERVCFVNNNNYSFGATMTMSSKSLQKRGRNVLDIELPSELKSNVSVAITDAEVDGNKPNDDNIITSLLFTGELRGYIRNPYYYFQNSADSLAQQLDLVMLTHGWRRFKWQDLAIGKTPAIKFPIEDYLSINAEVLGIDKSRISKEESLNIIMAGKDSSNNMLSVPQVTSGKFHLSGLVFYDTVKAFYMFNTDHKLSDQAAVIIKNGLYPGVRKQKPFNMTMPIWSPDDSSLIRKSQQLFVEADRLRTQDKIQNLQVVTIRRQVKSDKQKMDELYSSGLFSGGEATIFDVMDDISANGQLNIFNYLQSKVAGLQINTTSSPPTLSWRGGNPGLYLNESPADASQIQTIPMQDVAMVKVFSPGSAGGFSNSSGGVIAIYTKKGKDNAPDPSIKGLDMIRLIGYNKIREFYSPDYLTNPESETDDIRTTLYWNPYLKGSKSKNKFSIPFYNSDVTHHLRIILEGYDEEGKLIHMEKLID